MGVLVKKLSVLLIVVLVAVGCGGGNEGSDTTEGAARATTQTSADEPPDEEDDTSAAPTTAATVDAEDVEDFLGEGTATVTVNGETYYFGDAGFPAIQCMPNFFGVMLGFLQRVDESGAEIASGGGFQFALLLPGTDPEIVEQLNELNLDLGDLEQEWIANENHITERGLDPNTSQVDSVSFDGNTATGTATVYEQLSQEVAQLTFEVTCADN